MSKQDNTSAISVMFEDMMKKIDKLILLASTQTNDYSAEIKQIAEELTALRNQKEFTPEQISKLKGIAEELAQIIAKTVADKTAECIAEIKAMIDPIIERLDELQSDQDTNTPQAPQKQIIRHEFTVDFKNNKATFTIIMMAMLLFASLVGHIYQLDCTNRMKNNDLKYRYIKMAGGISPEDVARLERFFNDPDSSFVVKIIRKDVRDYETRLKERIEKEEQARLNAAKAERLKREAEELKHKI